MLFCPSADDSKLIYQFIFSFAMSLFYKFRMDFLALSPTLLPLHRPGLLAIMKASPAVPCAPGKTAETTGGCTHASPL